LDGRGGGATAPPPRVFAHYEPLPKERLTEPVIAQVMNLARAVLPWCSTTSTVEAEAGAARAAMLASRVCVDISLPLPPPQGETFGLNLSSTLNDVPSASAKSMLYG